LGSRKAAKLSTERSSDATNAPHRGPGRARARTRTRSRCASGSRRRRWICRPRGTVITDTTAWSATRRRSHESAQNRHMCNGSGTRRQDGAIQAHTQRTNATHAPTTQAGAKERANHTTQAEQGVGEGTRGQIQDHRGDAEQQSRAAREQPTPTVIAMRVRMAVPRKSE
jgi:hypothetical protein